VLRLRARLVLTRTLSALPVALITGELSSQFPEDGGFTLWVNEAFGPFWAFQEGYWSLVAGMTNNAMYMIMIVEIVQRAGTGHLQPAVRWTLGAAFAVGASAPNFLGVRMVGWSLLGAVVVVLAPYALMLPLAAPYVDVAQWQAGPVSVAPQRKLTGGHGSLSGWSLLMSTAFWNFGGFDSASTFAGEVHNPARTYPVALVASLVLITAGLVLPLLACTLAAASLQGAPPFAEWEDGTYVELGEALGGPVLKAMVVVSGFASQVAMFTTEMVVDSHLLLGMAQQRLAPKAWIMRDPGTGAPVVCIAVMLFVVLCGFTLLDRNSLLVMNNTFAGASVLLELAAAVKLRGAGASRTQQQQQQHHHHHHHHHKERFKAPCRSRFSLSLSLLPSIGISAYVVMPAIVASGARVAFNTGLLAITGVLLYAPFSAAEASSRKSLV